MAEETMTVDLTSESADKIAHEKREKTGSLDLSGTKLTQAERLISIPQESL
jgi:hypothetical protein